jgi:hypothetical protein
MVTDGSWEASGICDDQEGLCEAGVFVLSIGGWCLLFRKRFTQIGPARQWAQAMVEHLPPFAPSQWTILTESDGATLEEISTSLDSLRSAKRVTRAEDCAANRPADGGVQDGARFDAGGCQACVCVEVEYKNAREHLIVARKSFDNGDAARRWAKFAEMEIRQCSDVRACATIFVRAVVSDAEVLAVFQKLQKTNA